MKISFIGHGNIAKAMINGILSSGMLLPEDIFTSDSDEENQAAVDFADYVFLTVKPNMYNHVISRLIRTENKVFITVAPGIKTTFMDGKVVRTMPNTPALVGEGVTAVCRGSNVTDLELENVKKLLSTFSAVYEFDEAQMDYTIAVSGSSPAYGYMFIQAMAEYGAECGLDYETSKKMAAQALLGSAKMVLESGESPEILCNSVCAKGGTTAKAIEKLRALGFADIIFQAMNACTMRAIEMAGEHK